MLAAFEYGIYQEQNVGIDTVKEKLKVHYAQPGIAKELTEDEIRSKLVNWAKHNRYGPPCSPVQYKSALPCITAPTQARHIPATGSITVSTRRGCITKFQTKQRMSATVVNALHSRTCLCGAILNGLISATGRRTRSWAEQTSRSSPIRRLHLQSQGRRGRRRPMRPTTQVRQARIALLDHSSC